MQGGLLYNVLQIKCEVVEYIFFKVNQNPSFEFQRLAPPNAHFYIHDFTFIVINLSDYLLYLRIYTHLNNLSLKHTLYKKFKKPD